MPKLHKEPPQTPDNVQENYEGELQEWAAMMETEPIPSAISRGMLDLWIRDIARACFDRRDVLNGKEPGAAYREAMGESETETPEPKKPKVKAAEVTSADTAAATAPNTSELAAAVLSAAMQPSSVSRRANVPDIATAWHAGPEWLGTISAAMSNPQPGDHTYVTAPVNNKTYLRSDIVGKWFTVDSSYADPQYLQQGTPFYIVGAGEKFLKVEAMPSTVDGIPSSRKIGRDLRNNGYTYLSWRNIESYLL